MKKKNTVFLFLIRSFTRPSPGEGPVEGGDGAGPNPQTVTEEMEVKTLIKVLGFYGIAFAFTIILSIVQQASGIDAGIILLPQFGPGLAAVVMLLLAGNDLKIMIFSPRVPFRKYLAAIGIPFLVSAILFLLYTLFVRPPGFPQNNAASIMAMLAGMLLGAFGEELGWRGYLQKLLDRKWNGIAAFLIVGVLWGLWHVGNYHNGPAFMLYFVLSTIGYSAVMAWLLRGTEYNVVLACLFHFSINAGFYMLANALADLRLVAANGLVWIGAAVIVTAAGRRDFLRMRKGGADTKP
jgi:membrane protease YdiL (CAAX protease family)